MAEQQLDYPLTLGTQRSRFSAIDRAYLQTQKYIQNNNIPEALKVLPYKTAKDQYNHGTLKIRYALQEIQKDSLTGKQTAREYSNQAQEDFQNAINNNINPLIQNQIVHNTQIAQEANVVIHTKVCIDELSYIQSTITNNTQLLQEIQDTLNNQKTIVQKANMPTQCRQIIQERIAKNQQAIQYRQTDNNNTQKLTRALQIQYIQDPAQCLQTNFVQATQETTKLHQYIQAVAQAQKLLTESMQTSDQKIREELCKQQGSDGDVGNTIQQSYKQIQEALEKSPNPKDNNTQTTPPIQQYKNIDTDTQKLLEQLDTNNKSRIQKMQDIKIQQQYSPRDYIQELFNKFYGNPDDFTSSNE